MKRSFVPASIFTLRTFTMTSAKRSASITNFFKPQAKTARPVNGTASPAQSSSSEGARSTSFDKEEWFNKLTPDQQELLQLEKDTLDESWLAVLYPELTKPYFLNLKRKLKQEYESKAVIFPPSKDIYSWSRLTPLHKVKIIILGQDPYHNYNQAHGLAFSVKPPTTPPPSLKNIYKGIQNCYPDFKIPKDGSLIPWATQGVLLLNTCLTVKAHNAFSHANWGWEEFTEKVLEAAIKNRSSGVCFLAWGSPAGKRVDKILPPRQKHQHLVLKCVHPSPLSASRGFFTADHFKTANQWLYDRYGPDGVINWALDPSNVIEGIRKLRMTQAMKEAEKALLEGLSDEEDNATSQGETEVTAKAEKVEVTEKMVEDRASEAKVTQVEVSETVTEEKTGKTNQSSESQEPVPSQSAEKDSN
uniref:Uracil-DNA glycosylase n=1 Tax=Blastobotrys adeninivorans TaxID=409370 RepID=A0A060SX41_BLAAD